MGEEKLVILVGLMGLLVRPLSYGYVLMLGEWHLGIPWALAIAIVEEDSLSVTSIALGNISTEIFLLYFAGYYCD